MFLAKNKACRSKPQLILHQRHELIQVGEKKKKKKKVPVTIKNRRRGGLGLFTQKREELIGRYRPGDCFVMHLITPEPEVFTFKDS